MLNLLTDVPGVMVGHVGDVALGSGVTVVLFERPMVASGLVGGGAPGSRDVALLAPEMMCPTVDAFVLGGGSAFGLDAAGGVQAHLRALGRGLRIREAVVPVVPQAIVFDLLNGGNKDWGVFSPYREFGYAAARAATGGAFALGSVGAGTGATTATLKGGVGSASAMAASGHVVAALAVVNAVGSATIGRGPHFWAAPFEVGAEFGGLGWPAHIDPADLAPALKGGPAAAPDPATTIAVVVTDAVLTKAEAKRLAIMAHDGLARAVLPAHAPSDGDTIFAAATGTRPCGERDLTLIGQMATQVMARAIARGVYEAGSLPYPGAPPSWRDRFSAPVAG